MSYEDAVRYVCRYDSRELIIANNSEQLVRWACEDNTSCHSDASWSNYTFHVTDLRRAIELARGGAMSPDQLQRSVSRFCENRDTIGDRRASLGQVLLYTVVGTGVLLLLGF